VELNAAFADFLEDESCGRCSTCHGGNQRMTEIFRRVAAGGGRVEDRRGLELLGEALQYSNCVHGSASPTVMRNTLRFFEAEYEAHISGDGCGTLRCDGLTRFRVVDASDPALAEARAICPTGAIVPAGDNTPAGNGEPAGAGSSQRGAGGYRVLDAACIRCGACAELAPRGIAREPAPPAALQR
jgi:ferredoxin